MDRLDKIYQNPKFKEIMSKIEDIEKDRIYCKHDIAHSMDVARIAYITALEDGLSIKKDIIYAAALLHDLGRGVNYQNHVGESVKIAEEILSQSDFTGEEIEKILRAVNLHSQNDGNGLLGVIQKADKLSRLCFACKSIDTCKWSKEELNIKIKC